MFLRTTEQVTLHQIDTHFRQHREFFWQFDAFGDDLCARGFGDLQDRADELSLQRVLMNAIDEVSIDLHVVRAQLRPQTQAGIAGTEIIQCNGKTHRSIVMQGGLQQLEIVDGRLFGQFDDHLTGRNAEILQQLQCAPRLVGGFK
ncbi:hypothetical protein D3C72_2047420 [compost metagenome]